MQATLVTGEPQSYPFFMMGVTGKKTQVVGFDTGSQPFEDDRNARKAV